MAESKKYYWLKLKKDFFKRHDIRIIEEMANGKDYVLFYLKLLVESISHDGELRFNETVPYKDSMLATITNTNIDIVRSAIKIFVELDLMEVFDNGTLYMGEVTKMLGTETEWAEKKRNYRKSQDIKALEEPQKKDIVLPLSDKSKSKEIDIDIEKDTEPYILAEYLLNSILENNSNFRKPNLVSWSKHTEKMLRIDNRPYDEIVNVIDWCAADDFWRANILSTAKLREKYDQLIMKMNSFKKEEQSLEEYLRERGKL